MIICEPVKGNYLTKSKKKLVIINKRWYYINVEDAKVSFEYDKLVWRVKQMRVHITLECTECHERTYLSSKNKRNNPDRLELKKYCPRDHKVTLHRETK